MATLEQLEKGIRAAHAAGNAEHVKLLGAEYRRLQAEAAGTPPLNMSVTDAFARKQKTPPPAAMDYASQGMSGFNEGMAMALGAPVDLATAAINLGTSGINRVAGTSIPQIEKPVGGSESFREGIFAPTIKPESDDAGLKAVRRTAQELGAWSVPGGAVAAKTARPITKVAQELPAVLTSGGAAAAAQTIAPDNALVEFAAQMAGSMTPGGIKRMATRSGKAPDIDQLREIKNQAYENVKKAGVKYDAPSYDNMLVNLVNDVKGDNISPTRHERAYSFIGDMINRRGKPMTLTELDQLRQEVRRDLITPSYSNPNAAADAHFGEKIIDAIDDMIASHPTGSETMKAARLAHSRLRKSELIADAIYKANLQASATGSGGNINNAIRQQIKSILTNPKRSKAFTDAERAAMESLVKQGKIENLLRLIGKLSPSGNGLMAALGIGGTAMNPALAAAPLAGMAAKTLADSGTARKAAALQRQVAGAPTTRPPMPLPSPSLIYAQTANQLDSEPVEITVRGGAR